MTPNEQADFWAMTESLEGKVYCLYLDVLGLVTTAIGNLCDDPHVAMSMPFVRPDGTSATPDDIRAEHTRVKAAFCGVKGSESAEVQCAWKHTTNVCLAHRGWPAAMLKTALRLTDEGVKQIVLVKANANDRELRDRFPGFDAWPPQARLATRSMAWACGAGFDFPKLAEHLRAGDFALASTECTIREAGNAGVIPRNKRNRTLYLEAAGLSLPAFDLSDTRGLQGALARLGYSPGVIDGIPGKKTKAAVVAFQSAHHLTPDGIVGPKTRAMILLALQTTP